MLVVLIGLALASWGLGLLTLSNATMGVGGVATACFLGILARVAQATIHHKDMLAAVAASRERPE